VVTELTLPALRASLRALAWLQEEGVEGAVEVVVNKYANRPWEVSPAEAAKTLGVPIRALLPRDDAAVYTAVNSGLPLEEVKGGYEVFGLGPLEEFLKDSDISDILVNGPGAVYIERQGRLSLTDVKFRDEAHLMKVIDRIVSTIGRRLDRDSPMVDARLPDGS